MRVTRSAMRLVYAWGMGGGGGGRGSPEAAPPPPRCREGAARLQPLADGLDAEAGLLQAGDGRQDAVSAQDAPLNPRVEAVEARGERARPRHVPFEEGALPGGRREGALAAAALRYRRVRRRCSCGRLRLPGLREAVQTAQGRLELLRRDLRRERG